MFIAMNRFKVIKGEEKAFEHVWLSRETHLEKVPGFIEFHLLRGPERDDHTLYSSHTVWANADTSRPGPSEQFRRPTAARPAQAALPRPSGIRRLRGDPDGGAAATRDGRLTRGFLDPRYALRRGIPELTLLCCWIPWDRSDCPARRAWLGRRDPSAAGAERQGS